MSKRVKKPLGSPRERIMNVASDLFYHQGYRATGINEVIERSGVAKATFYSHFPSKDDLGQAYLIQGMEGEIAHIDNTIRAAKGAEARFFAVMHSLEPWMVDTDFRGCGFINIAAEIPDHKHPFRKVGRELYDLVWERVETLAKELIASDAKRYGHLDAKELTGEYMVAFTGAVALAAIYHAIWPVEDALNTVRHLIGQQPG
jgi:AcrR family transcriptional regulator